MLAAGSRIYAGNTGNLTVTANVASAGSLADTLAVSPTSNANSVAGLANKSLTGMSVVVAGGIYDYAKPTYLSTALAFGNLRVGAAPVNRTVNVANTLVTNAAYQDSLDVTGAVTAAGLSVTPSFNLLASTAGVVTVSSPNTFAGSLNDTLALGLVSNANNFAGLTNAPLTSGPSPSRAGCTITPTRPSPRPWPSAMSAPASPGDWTSPTP